MQYNSRRLQDVLSAHADHIFVCRTTHSPNWHKKIKQKEDAEKLKTSLGLNPEKRTESRSRAGQTNSQHTHARKPLAEIEIRGWKNLD